MATWFDVLFNGTTTQRWLSTAPGQPTTHWCAAHACTVSTSHSPQQICLVHIACCFASRLILLWRKESSVFCSSGTNGVTLMLGGRFAVRISHSSARHSRVTLHPFCRGT